jgi:Ca2+-transporting ATPase
MNQSPNPTQWHSLSVEKIYQKLSTSYTGLSSSDAQERLGLYGTNKLESSNKRGVLYYILQQLKSYLVWILVVAGSISFLTGHPIDGFIIIGIVILNIIISVYQEYKADKSIESLQNNLQDTALTLRDGEETMLESQYLVPGDVIILEEGDQIPADGRLIEVHNFRTSEAALTGESFPIDKRIEASQKDTAVGNRFNMIWFGTYAVGGTARAVIVETGQTTQLGQIASDLTDIETPPSHFELKAQVLSRQLGIVSLFAALLVFGVGYYIRGEELVEIFLYAVATLVSAIPESLPSVIVATLAIGARRMSTKKAIIRHLPATETLGVVDIICTDKTGTLTQNKMNINSLCILKGQKPLCLARSEVASLEGTPILSTLYTLCEYGNKAKIIHHEDAIEHIGDPTEVALVEFAQEIRGYLETLPEVSVIQDYPFESEFKMRATVVQETESLKVYVTGAAEEIIKHVDPSYRTRLLEVVEAFATKGDRVLAIASASIDSPDDFSSLQDVSELDFQAIVSMSDPLRVGIKEAVRTAKDIGLRTVMMTGDHALTAHTIGQTIGLINESDSVYTQSMVESLSQKEFDTVILSNNVFARLTPSMKMRITSRLQELGHMVAMTGDGVNDAPALKKADVGIAMGIAGTDVSRDAAKVILSDDNYSTIIDAVIEGRTVFKNVKKASYFLLSTNFAEITIILMSLLLALPLPLTASLILWLNLVTDGVNGIALAFDKPDIQILHSKPLNKDENILSRSVIPFITTMVAVMTTTTLVAFWYVLDQGYSLAFAQTIAFLIMAYSQLFNLPNVKAIDSSALRLSILDNPVLNYAIIISFIVLIVLPYSFIAGPLGLVAIPPLYMTGIIALSSLPLLVMEIYKFIAGIGRE